MSQSEPKSKHVWTFLPGLHGTNDLFGKLRELVPPNQMCEWINLPAQGKQDYSTLCQWLDGELECRQDQKRILIAESFSGPLAMKFAALQPENVAGLILASSFCDAPINPGIALLPLRPLFMVKPPRKALQHFLIGPDSSEIEQTELRQVIRTIPSSTLSKRVRAALELEAEDSPRLKDVPMLILQAKEDNLIPWEAQQRLEARYPDAHVHWVDAPHMIAQRHPGICMKHIVSFTNNLG